MLAVNSVMLETGGLKDCEGCLFHKSTTRNSLITDGEMTNVEGFH